MWPKYPAQLYLDTPNYSARIGGTTSLWPFPPNRTKRASEQASKRAYLVDPQQRWTYLHTGPKISASLEQTHD